MSFQTNTYIWLVATTATAFNTVYSYSISATKELEAGLILWFLLSLILVIRANLKEKTNGDDTK